jgi:hypothetical protein
MGELNIFGTEHELEHKDWLDGDQYIAKLSNGRGASIVRNQFSYGHETGRWELAVLDAEGRLDYSTPVTSGVRGNLTTGAVGALLHEIEALPADRRALTSGS